MAFDHSSSIGSLVRTVRRQTATLRLRPARSLLPRRRPGGGLRLSNTTTSPSCNSGISTISTYVRNSAASVAPGNASGARTPSRPSAALRSTAPSEVGDRAVISFASRRPSVGRSHCCVDPRLFHHNHDRFGSIRPTSLRNRRRFFWTVSAGFLIGRSWSSSCRSDRGDAGCSRSSSGYGSSRLAASTASRWRRSASGQTVEVAAGRDDSRRVSVHRRVAWEPKCRLCVTAAAAGR